MTTEPQPLADRLHALASELTRIVAEPLPAEAAPIGVDTAPKDVAKAVVQQAKALADATAVRACAEVTLQGVRGQLQAEHQRASIAELDELPGQFLAAWATLKEAMAAGAPDVVDALTSDEGVAAFRARGRAVLELDGIVHARANIAATIGEAGVAVQGLWTVCRVPADPARLFARWRDCAGAVIDYGAKVSRLTALERWQRIAEFEDLGFEVQLPGRREAEMRRDAWQSLHSEASGAVGMAGVVDHGQWVKIHEQRAVGRR
jgi:hypothetical protein